MTSNDRRPDKAPQATQEPIAPDRPSFQGFDEWLRQRGLVGVSVVIAAAFLAKTVVPVHSFTLGLLFGVVALAAFYLLSFHHDKAQK